MRERKLQIKTRPAGNEMDSQIFGQNHENWRVSDDLDGNIALYE